MPFSPRAILWRSLTLESSWHAQRMQGLGFLYALLPQLRGQDDLGEALERHSGYFNTNGAIAPAILGAVARLESEGRGAEAGRTCAVLAAPLSGQTDLFLWAALRPFTLTLAVIGALAGQPHVGMAMMLVAFNAPLSWLRWRGFQRGYSEGANLLHTLASVRPPKRLGRWLRAGIALLAGGLLTWGLIQGWGVEPGAAFNMGGAALVGYYAQRRDFSPGFTFLILVALSAVARRLEFSAIWLQ